MQKLHINLTNDKVKNYFADIRAKVKAVQAEVKNPKDDLENLKVELDEKREPASSKKSRQTHKAPLHKLHINSASELSRLNQHELLTDIQLLDGTFILVTFSHQLISYRQSN